MMETIELLRATNDMRLFSLNIIAFFMLCGPAGFRFALWIGERQRPRIHYDNRPDVLTARIYYGCAVVFFGLNIYLR